MHYKIYNTRIYNYLLICLCCRLVDAQSKFDLGEGAHIERALKMQCSSLYSLYKHRRNPTNTYKGGKKGKAALQAEIELLKGVNDAMRAELEFLKAESQRKEQATLRKEHAALEKQEATEKKLELIMQTLGLWLGNLLSL